MGSTIDTCASNLMMRDEKMRKLVDDNDETITPFLDRALGFYRKYGISTILVSGGSGNYFQISNTVIQMINYEPYDVTEKASLIARESEQTTATIPDLPEMANRQRYPVPASVNTLNDYNKRSIYAKEIHRINFGSEVIDLTDVEQISELSQTKAIMIALEFIIPYINGNRNVIEIYKLIEKQLNDGGLDRLSDKTNGNLAEFRVLEFACALNRLRSLNIGTVHFFN